MIPDQWIQVTIGTKSKRHFAERGYDVADLRQGDPLRVRANDLMASAKFSVGYVCDRCGASGSAPWFSLSSKNEHLCRACTQKGKTPGNKRVFSNSEVNFISRQYMEEMSSPDEIAKLLSCSGPTIRKALRGMGIQVARRPKPPNVTCETCGKLFRRTPKEMKPVNYCSRQCAAQRLVVDVVRECEHCGLEYMSKPHMTGRRYCSSACWYDANKKGMATTCETCGVAIWSTPGRPKTFCSKACAGEAQRTGQAIACANCGGMRYVPDCHQRSDVAFCSQDCHHEYKQRNEHYSKSIGRRISKAHRDKWDHDEEWARERRVALSLQALTNIERGVYRGSALEDLVSELLDGVGVAYTRWKRVFSNEYGIVKEYDFYFTDTDAYLEVHGGFWHADPRMYPDRHALSHVQIRNLKNDEIKKQIVAGELKRPLHVIWEQDVHADQGSVVDKLKHWGISPG